jgi:hypothetical protein
VDYQPKVLTGAGGRRALSNLAAMSGEHGHRLNVGATGASVTISRGTSEGARP